LTDSNFPLFISFDQVSFASLFLLLTVPFFQSSLTCCVRFLSQLCTLLENELVPLPPISKKRPPLVTHRLFLLRYWKTFNEKLTAGLDPSLVYGELLGVIK